jgi:nucleoside-diphosphate-sugar epimerase
MLVAARDAVKRFVYAASLSTYGDSENYQNKKKKSANLCSYAITNM